MLKLAWRKDLHLEDQISLFIPNEGSNRTKDGKVPSEKVLGYRPRILFDLNNPINQYRNNILTPNDVHHDVLIPTGKPINVEDPLGKLVAEDEVWYKTHNPHNPYRWLKATFLKKFSQNTFQVQIGRVDLFAHRT